MAAPETKTDKWAAMYDWAGIQIFNLVRQSFEPSKTRILDVGAGWGKYRFLLPDYAMDACEVWEPYIIEEKLDSLYDTVYHADIYDFEPQLYDVIIMGDILEHLPRPRAQATIKKLVNRCQQIYVVVPFMYPQGAVHGNDYEIHHQDDLTPAIMQAAYPELEVICLSDEKGIYVKK